MDNTPPAHPTPGCLVQLLPAVTASRHVCIGVSAPCVIGSSPPLSLWIPGQSLPGILLTNSRLTSQLLVLNAKSAVFIV